MLRIESPGTCILHLYINGEHVGKYAKIPMEVPRAAPIEGFHVENAFHIDEFPTNAGGWFMLVVEPNFG